MSFNHCRRWALLSLLSLTLVGCAAKPDVNEVAKAHLNQIAKAYLGIVGYHRRPPRDMEELQLGVRDLHLLELGAPAEEALVSPRDKLPFVIVMGADDSDPGDSLLVYEQQGSEGARLAITVGGEVKQLTDEEFYKASFPKGHKPKGK